MLSLLVLGLGVGCGRISRIRECRAITELVNGSLADIEQKARPRTPAAYRSAGLGYTELSKGVRRARLAGATGQTALEEYAGMLASVATAAQAYAAALETQHRPGIEEAEGSLERFRRHEQSLIARIDAYCHAP